jgi:pyruvate/2-oxoglutarate/acetoin dehydrogenase E1 component
MKNIRFTLILLAVFCFTTFIAAPTTPPVQAQQTAPAAVKKTEQMVPAIAAHNGPVYMRLLRGQVPLVLDEYGYQFELGKAKLLRGGKDVLVISSGILTMRALEVAKALDDIRRGAANTAQALGQQSTASTQVSVEAARLSTGIANVSAAVAEQSTAMKQITQATESVSRQTAQTARAMEEQARASRDLVTATQDVARQSGLITVANREQTKAVEAVLKEIAELRRTADVAGKAARDIATLGNQLPDRARSMRPPA